MDASPQNHFFSHHLNGDGRPASPTSISFPQKGRREDKEASESEDEDEDDDGHASSPSDVAGVVAGDDSGQQLEDAVKDGLVGGIMGEVLNGATEEEAEPSEEESEEVEEDDFKEGDESGSESESGSDEEDGNEEEEEPVLKYARLGPGATEVLTKDSASAVASSSRFIAIGTHAGMVHVLSYSGQKLSSYRAHTASVMAICISDDGSEFIGTASFDGKVVINSLLTPERYSHDFKRPLRSLALEPNFAKRSSKAFVAGGMAGTLSLMEKSWLGGLGGLGGLGSAMGIGGGGNGHHKETVLHGGEGPIWGAVWEKGGLIAWANDLGVKIYDTDSQRLITFVDRPPDSPRADLFKPILVFISGTPPSEPTTLIIAWADHIKLARIRTRNARHARPASLHHASLTSSPSIPQSSGPTLHVEITAIFQVDCMISGLTTYKNDFLVLAYLPPDEETFANEATSSREEQRRKAAQRPELRIISRRGEELSSDALSLNGYHLNGCNDYSLVPAVAGVGEKREGMFVVLSPRDVVVARERDGKDRVAWLVERKRYEEALDMVEKLKKAGVEDGDDGSLNVRDIGEKFLESLMQAGEYSKAASLCPKVLGQDKKAWEDCIFHFAQRKQLQAIIPFTPIKDPQLSDLVYEMILAHFLTSDRPALLRIIKEWPPEIYRISSVVNAVEGTLNESPREKILMECLAELFVLNRQPGKALPYYLRLRRPNVFDLIREFNLFTAVRDQALLLVEFDMELNEKGIADGAQNGTTEKSAGLDGMAVDGDKTGTGKHGKAIQLLVDHSHSIPIARVISQLGERPKYLFMYLDSLFEKDPHLVAQYGDQHIALCAEFDYPRLMDLLRSSIEYSLEKAYRITKEKDYVPEMVFLLGRMGNSKDALMLIIERLGDVQRAIEFAKEQNDPDLWEDLLRYSENKPRFIRGLLENVGAGIDPVLLIRRIKDGLEIPGLKEALIKILQDFSLQISLLEGCQTILHTDCSGFSVDLNKGQTHGFLGTPTTTCVVCSLPVFKPAPLPSAGQQVVLVFLCRHVVHAACALEDPSDELPPREEGFRSLLLDSGEKKGWAGGAQRNGRSFGAKLSYAASLRAKLPRGCPHCRPTTAKNAGTTWT